MIKRSQARRGRYEVAAQGYSIRPIVGQAVDADAPQSCTFRPARGQQPNWVPVRVAVEAAPSQFTVRSRKLAHDRALIARQGHRSASNQEAEAMRWYREQAENPQIPLSRGFLLESASRVL
jgi:hypothetical protein